MGSKGEGKSSTMTVTPYSAAALTMRFRPCTSRAAACSRLILARSSGTTFSTIMSLSVPWARAVRAARQPLSTAARKAASSGVVRCTQWM